MDSTLEDTLGIDCMKFAKLDVSFDKQLVLETTTGSPRRLSTDFFKGLIGASPPHKRRRGADMGDMECETRQRVLRTRSSTPRRSIRVQAAKKLAAKAAVVMAQKANFPQTKPIRSSAQPRSNKAIELRKQALARSHQEANKKNKGHSSKSQTMKPEFSQTQKRQCTQPKTPDMIRRLKNSGSKPRNYKSNQEKEDDEVQAMKSYKFKAQPVPRTVKKAPPKVVLPHKPPTVPNPPNITISKKRKIEEVDSNVEFKANPAPSRKVQLIHKAKSCKTSPKPFSFDSKYIDREQNRKKMVNEEMSKLKKAREFKAHPMPVSNVENVPPKTGKQRSRSALPTFQLPGDAVSKRKKLAFQTKIDEEASKRKSEAQFKSREPSVLKKKPFKPVL